jgi:hypothetical protein
MRFIRRMARPWIFCFACDDDDNVIFRALLVRSEGSIDASVGISSRDVCLSVCMYVWLYVQRN